MKLYGIDPLEKIHLDTTFTYQSPNSDQLIKSSEVREDARNLAYIIMTRVPPSNERDTAIERLEECVMWANKGISNELDGAE